MHNSKLKLIKSNCIVLVYYLCVTDYACTFLDATACLDVPFNKVFYNYVLYTYNTSAFIDRELAIIFRKINF